MGSVQVISYRGSAMADAEIAQKGLGQAVERFPEAARALRRLVQTHPEFREICEEYALAQQSLSMYEASSDAVERPEIGEYRTVIAELETEIFRFLNEKGTND